MPFIDSGWMQEVQLWPDNITRTNLQQDLEILERADMKITESTIKTK